MKVNTFRNPIITIFTFQTKTTHMRKFLTVVGVLLIFSISAIAQTKEITGKITDETGAPIPGATVRLKGKKSGVSADANGTFRINTPGNAILLISGIGFEPQEIATGNLQTIPVTLKRANTALNEVVVTALGISREKKA